MPRHAPIVLLMLMAGTCAIHASAGAPAPIEGDAAGPPQFGPAAPDELVGRIFKALEGAWAGDGVTLHVSTVNTLDLPKSAYVEMTAKGRDFSPHWRQVWTPYVKDGVARVRVSEFAGGTKYADLYTAAWAAPEVFPPVSTERVDAVGDLAVSLGEGAVTLKSPAPMPFFRAGGIDLTLAVDVNGDDLRWTAVGLAGDGARVWGDEAPLTFRRVKEARKADLRPSGLIVIDLVTGEGPKAELKDSVAIHQDVYTTTGALVHSTRSSGQNLISKELPSSFPPGWNEGALGMQAGGKRRVIVPPQLGYGEKGVPGTIPPNSWLIFDLDLVSLKDNTPDVAPERLDVPIPRPVEEDGGGE